MASLAENITRNINAIDNIKQAIIDKGQSVPANTPVEQYPAKILAISGGGGSESATWERPSIRRNIPTEENNTIVMLFGVQEATPNDIAFAITCVGGYAVKWADGITETFASGAKAEHLHNYAIMPSDSWREETYLMNWIVITPTIAGNEITVFNTQQRHTMRSTVSTATMIPQIFEMYIECSALTSLTWRMSAASSGTVQHSLLEIFSLAENNITAAAVYLLGYSYNLKKINKLHTEKMSSIANFMDGCRSYNQPFPNNATFNNATTSFMSGCYSYNQPFPNNATFNNATTNFMNSCHSYNQPFPNNATFNNATTNFMYNCYSYNQPFPNNATFNNATTSFMYNCYSYNQPFPNNATFNNATTSFMYNCYSYNQPFPNNATFNNATTNFMYSCYSYNQILTVNLSRITLPIDATFIGAMCYALKGFRIINMSTIHVILTLSNSSLDVNALVALFGDLANRTSTTVGTITITNVFGAAALTTAQRAIATSKNWTIVG